MNDETGECEVKVICDKCGITYNYGQPSNSDVIMLASGVPLVTPENEKALSNTIDVKRKMVCHASDYLSGELFDEGTIYCPECQTYYRFKYRVDPLHLNPLAGQEIHVKKETNILQPWEQEWFKYWRDAVKDSPVVINDASKYIIGIISGIIAIYTAGLAFMGISKVTGSYLFDVLLIAPIAIWLFAIGMCINAYSPDLYDSKSDSIISIKNAYQNISHHKFASLQLAVIIFLAGVFLAAVLLIAGAGIAPGIMNEKSHNVQFIVTNNSSQKLLEQMYITMEPGTQRTINLTLNNVTDDLYIVNLNNSLEVKFSKDVVDGVIYWD